MRLSPREIDGLLVHNAGFIAQKRLARGLKLNHPEAVALISCQIQEFARDGYSVSEITTKGYKLLGNLNVLPGVAELIAEVTVEATFSDGTKLVCLHHPIRGDFGDLELSLYGSFLPIPSNDVFTIYNSKNMLDCAGRIKQLSEAIGKFGDTEANLSVCKAPGEYIIHNNDSIELNSGKRLIAIKVTNTADRPIQVGSHYPFFETNKALKFDRTQAYGMRLNIGAGLALRFEPGDERVVTLVEISGKRVVCGGNNLTGGAINPATLPEAMNRVVNGGFLNEVQKETFPVVPLTMPRSSYVAHYGPTVGDKLRLGDTSLVIEVDKDFARYGDELIFGGGKVVRDGMGQSNSKDPKNIVDLVITNALIIDSIQGITKADIGITNGKIVGIGKAGNPDIMEGVDTNLIVGCNTEIISGEGKIVTAGAIDTHVHFICPQLIEQALASGVTTLIGGGTGPAEGTRATTCTSGPNAIRNMMEACDNFPMNFGFTGKGNSSQLSGYSAELESQIIAGALGLKLHEDWASTPAAIDACLKVADKYDVQATLHSDTLNESGCVEETIAAFKGRTIHAYHTEGAGGGHAPDIMKVCSFSNVLPSSTNPTRPYTKNTIDEALDMLLICHHLDKNVREDLHFAESRIRAETIAAEDVLHDIGAISMFSSDAQAMGRIGETICRTWQTADKMKIVRGSLPQETGNNDNFRVRRYIAKYTINPALAHGIAEYVGSVEVGKMADLVLWNQAQFGAKPEMVLKGGQIVFANMGLANASIPTPEPVIMRPMFGAFGTSPSKNSVYFVSKISLEKIYDISQKYRVKRNFLPVKGNRTVTKKDMILNGETPNIQIDPETYKVTLHKENGQIEHLTAPPDDHIPLARRYFLF